MRHLELKDTSFLKSILSDPKTINEISFLGPLEDHLIERLVENYISKTHLPFGLWVVEFLDQAKSEPCGLLFLGERVEEPVGEIEIGYLLIENFRGQGLGTELVVDLVKYAFSLQDIPHIFAFTKKYNKASQKILLKAGFQWQGSKFYYSRSKNEDVELDEFRITSDIGV